MTYMESDLMWYERESERFAEGLPHCSVCGNPIYDDYTYVLNDEYYCETCWEEFERECRVSTDLLVS